MAKIPTCPKHKIPLSLQNKSIKVAGSERYVCIGSCPKCSAMYINQKFLSGANIMIEGKKYEYLSELPQIDEIASKNMLTREIPIARPADTVSGAMLFNGEKRTVIVKDTTEAEKKLQQMDDIEHHFLAMEKEVKHQEEIEGLRKQIGALRAQLEEMRKKAADVENLYRRVTAEVQAEHQRQMNQMEHAFEEKYKTKLNATIAEYQDRIDRLNSIHKKAVAEMQKVTQSNLEIERSRTAVLLRENAALRSQVEELTRKLTQTSRPVKQVVFVDEKLFVCGGTIRCEKYDHQREDVTGIIDTIKGTPVAMTVCHCKDCGLYFIRDAVFESYREKYGTLLGKFIRKKDGMNMEQVSGYGELAPESILHMNGYNVNQTVNLSSNERHRILTYIIESGIMNRREIRNHLSYLIKMNQTNPSKDVAVSRWGSDLLWVNDYSVGTQDIVWLSGTAMYKHRRK